jgi:hypothetical protein
LGYRNAGPAGSSNRRYRIVEIEKHLDQFDSGHTDFQIDHFIIGAQGHLFFQYKQACRELKVRYEAIQQLNGSDCEVQKREARRLLRLADILRKRLNWDNLTDTEKIILEQNAWLEKAKYLIGLDLLCSRGQSVQKSTMEFVLKLPKVMRKELIGELNNNGGKKLIDYVVEK